MALNKQALATQLKEIFDSVSPDENEEVDPDVLRQKIATKMADAIDDFVKGATVTVDSGISVTTTGSATAQTGQTTNKGNGTIS